MKPRLAATVGFCLSRVLPLLTWRGVACVVGVRAVEFSCVLAVPAVSFSVILVVFFMM